MTTMRASCRRGLVAWSVVLLAAFLETSSSGQSAPAGAPSAPEKLRRFHLEDAPVDPTELFTDSLMPDPPAQAVPPKPETPAEKPPAAGPSSPGSGKRSVLRGATRASERAVAAALNWLARHQMPDGRWSLDKFTERCKDATCTGAGKCPNADSAATALALLPFLGADQTHTSKGPYQKIIRAGIDWLLKNQNSGTGDLRCGQSMYAHGLAAVCLCEAYGLSNDAKLRPAAQNALRFIVEAQSKEDGGWRYSPGDSGDLSVTGWQLMALKSGQMAGLQVPRAAFDKAKAFLDACAIGNSKGLFRYMPAYGHKGSNTMTAVGLLCNQ